MRDEIPNVPGYNQEQVNSSFMVPRADLRPSIFDSAIDHKGYRVIWEKGMFCSCYTPDSGQPDYNCRTCKGKGYKYFEPKEIKVLVTSINGSKQQDRPGLIELGTAYLTPKSTDRVGFRDRFTFLDFSIRYSEVLYHRSGQEDVLRYPCLETVRISKLDKLYDEGVHFELSEDRTRITWKDDHLYDREAYSILYYIRPVYIAINPVHELRGTYTMHKGGGVDQWAKLPDQFQIKREDFLDPHSKRADYNV